MEFVLLFVFELGIRAMCAYICYTIVSDEHTAAKVGAAVIGFFLGLVGIVLALIIKWFCGWLRGNKESE